MPICPICDDSGLQNSDSARPEFCYCAAGKAAKRQWEGERGGNRSKGQVRAASFIDIARLDEVNASVDAMRASLLGATTNDPAAPVKHPALQLLYAVAHAGHEVSAPEATQLYDLAKALEGFLLNLAPIGRSVKAQERE
jgi:hypothetical protein